MISKRKTVGGKVGSRVLERPCIASLYCPLLPRCRAVKSLSGTIRGKKVSDWQKPNVFALFSIQNCTRHLVSYPLVKWRQNAVRSVLDVFTQSSKFESELLEQLYNEEKNNTIVVYVTSVNAVRQTREDCDKMLKVSCFGKKLLSWGSLSIHLLNLFRCRFLRITGRRYASKTLPWTAA